MLRVTVGLLVAVTALAPAPAAGQLLGPSQARVEVGASVAAGDEPATVAYAMRGGVSWRPLLLEASLDLGAYVNGGEREFDVVLLAGAGASIPLRGRWSASALAVGGMHALGTSEEDGIGYEEHTLPAVGARLGVTRGRAVDSRLAFPSVTFAVTLIRDLRRERDFFLGRDVGGFRALVSATVGIGLGRGDSGR